MNLQSFHGVDAALSFVQTKSTAGRDALHTGHSSLMSTH